MADKQNFVFKGCNSPSTFIVFSFHQNQHVSGEQKQPGDGDDSDFCLRSSVQEQPEAARGCRGELRRAAVAAGHLGERRHPEAPAVGCPAIWTVCHPHRGVCSCSKGGQVFRWHGVQNVQQILLLTNLFEPLDSNPIYSLNLIKRKCHIVTCWFIQIPDHHSTCLIL